MIKEREKKVKADSDILKNMLEEIQEKTTQIESELKKAKRGASRIKEDLIEEGESVREKIVEETRNRTKEMMERKMAELDKALTDAEKKLEKEIASFSDKIKEKFL